jgi:hypothetical protein
MVIVMLPLVVRPVFITAGGGNIWFMLTPVAFKASTRAELFTLDEFGVMGNQ